MNSAAPGVEVYVEYQGILENGEVFDSTEESGTLQFVLGTGSVMPPFEEALMGMGEGEEKEIVIQPEEAFGPHQPELIQEIDRAKFGAKVDQLKEGMVINLSVDQDGQPHQVPALVTALGEETITVDYNHPLAGQVIRYKITLSKIGERKTNLPPIAPGQ
ncbi:MAG: peptidylprolyl isomerase [Thermodesulfobacteriota bacterium]